jgi:endonuclease-8
VGVPEGDSVYQLAARLRPALDGHTLTGGEIRSGTAAGTPMSGWRVLEHDTYGKHLLTRFDNGHTLHTHLRMQGSSTISPKGRTLHRRVLPDVRVRFVADTGATVWGVDLPVVDLVPTRAEHTLIGHLGPDPLRPDWNPDDAVARLNARARQPVIHALLDQRVIAGLGNMWANEICFLQGFYPWTPTGNVDTRRLVDRAARGLTASVTLPGMFQTTTGNQHRGERHYVVGRAGRPCLRCGTLICATAEVPNDPEQRRTWWCPHCQPAPT